MYWLKFQFFKAISVFRMLVKEQMLSRRQLIFSYHSGKTNHEIWPNPVNVAKFSSPVGVPGFHSTFIWWNSPKRTSRSTYREPDHVIRNVWPRRNIETWELGKWDSLSIQGQSYEKVSDQFAFYNNNKGINYKFMCLCSHGQSVKSSQITRENFCNFCKKIFKISC